MPDTTADRPALVVSSNALGTIRAVAPDDVPPLEAVIDGTGLFPGEMLDGMLAGYLSAAGADELWLTVDAPAPDGGPEGAGGPVAVAYAAPERMTTGTWNLYLIAVDVGRQGRGVGGALMRHVEQTLAARGARVLLVKTSALPDFARTRAFYRARGYAEEARIRAFYAAGEDKVVFWKALDGAAP